MNVTDPQQCIIESMHFNKADHYFGFYELFIQETRENIYLISESAAPTNLGSWSGAGDLWGLLTLRFFIHTIKRPSNFY